MNSGWTLYFPYAVAFWLFVAGCYGITQSRNLIHTILCLTVVQSSTYILLMSIDFHAKAGAPIFSSTNPPGSPSVDPIIHALTLTDIVVGATVSALLLALTLQIYRRTGTIDPAKLRPMED
jgi:multicomponent Na+:H+ antiporter subunit C